MIANIQVLRALAALLVVVAHCGPIAAPLGLAGGFERFGRGVDLFFVISGFIMAHTTRTRTPTPIGFLRNRIARVVPLYWLLTLVTFAVALLARSLLNGTDANPADLIRSLLFIPYERGDGTLRPILFVGWSLNYEMLFYLIFAGGLVISSERRRVIAVIGAIVALIVAGALLGRTLPREIAFFTMPIMIEFAFGMALALAYPLLPRSRGMAVAATIAAPLLLLVMLFAVPPVNWPVAAIPAAGLVLCALVMERGRIAVAWPLPILLGDASYSLYLTHPFVAAAMCRIALRLGLVNAVTMVPLIAAILVTSSIAAVLTFRFAEMPLSRAARRLLGVSRQIPAARGL